MRKSNGAASITGDASGEVAVLSSSRYTSVVALAVGVCVTRRLAICQAVLGPSMCTCRLSKRTKGSVASTLVVLRVTLTVCPLPVPVWPICSMDTSPALVRVMRTVMR